MSFLSTGPAALYRPSARLAKRDRAAGPLKASPVVDKITKVWYNGEVYRLCLHYFEQFDTIGKSFFSLASKDLSDVLRGGSVVNDTIKQEFVREHNAYRT